MSEASGIDFDTEGQQEMDPQEIDESLLGLRAEIEPKVPKKAKSLSNVQVDPITGEAKFERKSKR